MRRVTSLRTGTSSSRRTRRRGCGFPLAGGTSCAVSQESIGSIQVFRGEAVLHRLVVEHGSGECVFSLVHPLHRDHCSFLVTGTSPRHASVFGGFQKFVLSFALARFARGIWCIISVVLLPLSPCSVCMGVAFEYKTLDFSGDVCFPGAMLGSTVDTVYASTLAFGYDFTHFLRCGRLES